MTRRVRFASVLVAAGLTAWSTAQAAAQVDVTFVAPDRYTDAQDRSGSGLSLRVTLAEIRRLFVELGGRVLQPGQSLSIDVLDIDLAGIDRPGANLPFGVRVVSDIGPPRFVLRYTLKERGRVVLAARETVTNIDFLVRYARSAGSATFYYERELIRDWLQSRIVLRRPASG